MLERPLNTIQKLDLIRRMLLSGVALILICVSRFESKIILLRSTSDLFNDCIPEQMFFVLPDGDKLHLPVDSRFDPMISFAPFVTLNKQAEQIAVNFGERKFIHDPFGVRSCIRIKSTWSTVLIRNLGGDHQNSFILCQRRRYYAKIALWFDSEIFYQWHWL